jgi:hypothetical protein
MVDTKNTPAGEVEDVFDDAKDDFPAKEDLKDRLIAVWATGKHGKRLADGPGARPYAWFETITLVLDDGPNWDGMKIDADGERVANLVPSVAENGPQRLDGFQWTQSGTTSRIEARVAMSATVAKVNGDPVYDKPKTFRPMLGRVNSRKNKTAGRSASWSIGEPTPEDKVIAREYTELMVQISAELENPPVAASDDEFDE